MKQIFIIQPEALNGLTWTAPDEDSSEEALNCVPPSLAKEEERLPSNGRNNEVNGRKREYILSSPGRFRESWLATMWNIRMAIK